jgi:hypothetical protein
MHSSGNGRSDGDSSPISVCLKKLQRDFSLVFEREERDTTLTLKIFNWTYRYLSHNFMNPAVGKLSLHFHQMFMQRNRHPVPLNSLNNQDQAEYTHMRELFCEAKGWAAKNRSSERFGQILATLNHFVMKGDGNDAQRGKVCGIFWIHNQIAINPLQLCELISKSKSSINAGFQALRYHTIPATNRLALRFRDALQLSYDTIRHWTLRIPNTESEELLTDPQIRQASSELSPMTDNVSEDGQESPSSESFEFFHEDVYWDWDFPEA